MTFVYVMLVATHLSGSTVGPVLEAGAAKAEITPAVGYPMWGYATRKDRPSVGIRDALFARVLVFKAGLGKIAIVSLDLGRPPTRESMARIRKGLEGDGFAEIFLAASHTHHGPILELATWPPQGKPYVVDLEEKLVAAIRDADSRRRPARIAIASTEVALNRNRQSKQNDAPVDRELLVMRVDDLTGKTLAMAVNFAAHPTLLPVDDMRFSADYPGAMAKAVEEQTRVPCLFLQGAAGDLSIRQSNAAKGVDEVGKQLAKLVLELSASAKPVAITGDLVAKREEFKFRCLINVKNPFIRTALDRAFFPELIGFFEKEYAEGVRPHVCVAMLGESIGVVGASGEFFADHALSLKRRARLEHLFFLGYCNDYQQYFPTIQSVAEGGYGTGLPVSVSEIGAGERMIDRALIVLYQLRGKLPE